LLLSILCLTLTPQNVSSKTQDIKVLSYSHYIDTLGFLDIVGEIQNVGTNTIRRAVLTVTVYGTDGAHQGNVTGYAWLSYMAPQQKSPFLLDIVAPIDYPDWYSAGVSKIDVSVREANETISHLYSDFEVSVVSAGVSVSGSDRGAYWVNGNVQNVGFQTASNVAVAATFYNSLGDVVAVGRTDYLVPTNVGPSGDVTFKLCAFDTNQTAEVESRQITSYVLFVQADLPLIDGKASPVTTTATGNSIVSQQTNNPEQSSNQNRLYIIIIVAVIATVIVALLVSRKGKSSKN
jgi:hypothetical protein